MDRRDAEAVEDVRVGDPQGERVSLLRGREHVRVDQRLDLVEHVGAGDGRSPRLDLLDDELLPLRSSRSPPSCSHASAVRRGCMP